MIFCREIRLSLSRAIKIFGILYENSKKSGRLQRAVVRSVRRFHLDLVVVHHAHVPVTVVPPRTPGEEMITVRGAEVTTKTGKKKR